MGEPSTEIAVQHAEIVPTKLFYGGAADVVRQATDVANVLAALIEEKKLYVLIGKSKHVELEGWTLLGTFLGVFPVETRTERIPEDIREVCLGYKARVEARAMNGNVVSAAEALCMREEDNWADSDEYALCSMAQTRAASKALRLPLSFVMSLAGYATTPAEEMDGVRRRDGRPRGKLASDKQIEFLNKLIAKHGTTIAAVCAHLEINDFGELTGKLASEAIDELNTAKPGSVTWATKPATTNGDGEDVVPPLSTDADWNPEPTPATAPKPASKDAIPGVDPTAKPLLSAANDLAIRLRYSPQGVANVAVRLFQRNVTPKDLPGLSEAEAEKLVTELEARWNAEQGGEA